MEFGQKKIIREIDIYTGAPNCIQYWGCTYYIEFQKMIFGTFLKLQKMEFGQKKIVKLIYLISQAFFGLAFFKFSGQLWVN